MSSAGLVLPRWDAASTRAEQPHQKYLGRKSDVCVKRLQQGEEIREDAI